MSSLTNLLQFEQQAVVNEQASAVSFITAVLLGIALCFHSLLEVGVKDDDGDIGVHVCDDGVRLCDELLIVA